MELLQLKYLCTAARLENFSRAARHHNIPQSAISKTVSQLERELGVQLFVRSGNRVTLSEAGKKFCRQVQKALDILGEAAEGAKGKAEGALHGEVRLLLEEHESDLFYLLSDFRRENPGVLLHVAHTPSPDFDYDLRLSARAALSDRLGADDLRPAEVFLLTPATHRLAEWDRVPLSALRGEKRVSLATETPASVLVSERLRRAGIEMHTVLTCEDAAGLCAYVGAGAGVAFAAGVHEASAREQGVRLSRLQDEELRYPTCLSYRRTLSPPAAALREAILAKLR